MRPTACGSIFGKQQLLPCELFRELGGRTPSPPEPPTPFTAATLKKNLPRQDLPKVLQQ